MSTSTGPDGPTRIDANDFVELTQLYAAYAATADAGDWEAWIALFTEDCDYKLIPRENHDRGLPLATLAFRGAGMLKDRAYAVRETLFHDPYYQRHVMGLPRLLAVDANSMQCEANYAVFRTKLSQPSTVFNVGRSLDTVAHTPQGLRFARRWCIYDTELVPNSIIYPI